MGLTKQTYSMQDLAEQDLNTAPSLDIPGLSVEKFYMPRDNGKYMLFLANVKKSVRPEQCPFCKKWIVLYLQDVRLCVLYTTLFETITELTLLCNRFVFSAKGVDRDLYLKYLE